jgi:uncharacterized protein
MSIIENKALIRSSFAALSRGNAQAFLENIADNVRYTIIGNTKYSGTFNSKKEVVEKLLTPLGQELEGGITISPDNLIAEGDIVVMQGHGMAKAKNGKSYNNTYCHVFRIANSKIHEITEYLDTELATKVFGAR